MMMGDAGRARVMRMAALVCAAQMAIAFGADARYQHGWLLLQNERERTITLTRGAETRTIAYEGWPRESRGTTFRDMALLNDGRAAISITAALPLGEQENAVLYFDPAQPKDAPEIVSTKTVICHQIAEAMGQVWCLGPDFAEMVRSSNFALLHQVTSHGIIPVLERKHLPRQSTKAAWLPSPSGEAALLPVGKEGLLAWLPNARQIIALQPEGMRQYDLPLDTNKQASISVAVADDARVYAMLPLLIGDQVESLTTPYGLFALNRLGGDRWVRVMGSPEFTRGTRVLAIEGSEAVLIDRLRKVMRVRVN